MNARPLHAVLLPPEPGGGRLLDLLSAALDGTGPAILPLDPALPRPRLAELLSVFAPSAIETPDGTERFASHDRPSPGSAVAGPAAEGVDPDVAVVVATSGSTGAPKGVQLSAAALRASAVASLARIGADPAARPGQRWLCCLPAFHVAGLQVLVRSMIAGTSPVVTDGVDAAAVASCGCAFVSLVPTQLRRLLDSRAPLAAFDAILLGGAGAPAGLLAEARAAGARVITTYGMSETCGGCVYDGLPLSGVRLRISDAGLIGISGTVLFSGYRSRESAGSALDGDGWFWTADLGTLDDAGRLTVRGRADDVINSGGEKVVPGDVESVLGTLDGVRDVVIVGVPDSEWGELVTAVIVPEDPAVPPELARLRAQARERIPGFAAPRRLILVAEIPMLASGKPDRQALRAAAASQGGRA
ncbi:MAG TPA: AMP-binding protein [Streptosporangiaceae bacterium]|nr:AMP-binding protein [Streptosporangiaceae bacterium]